jgi:hypothetical protein
MRRRVFITLLGGAAIAWGSAARAQGPAKIYRVGYLVGGSARYLLDAFVQELGDLGYIEGQDVVDTRLMGFPTIAHVPRTPGDALASERSCANSCLGAKSLSGFSTARRCAAVGWRVRLLRYTYRTRVLPAGREAGCRAHPLIAPQLSALTGGNQ